jgi:uncharacterized protein (TIGR00299 family) protein
MTRALLIDAFSGLSGDMFLAALVHLGADPREIESSLGSLEGLEPFRLACGRVERGVIAATRLTVDAEPGREHRHYPDIVRMIETSSLSGGVKENGKRVFEVLARAEAAVHGTTIEKVHFHEVGAVDSIVDILGSLVGLEQLEVEEVRAARVRLGKGEVDCRHGRIPVPAPATLEILSNFPVTWSDRPEELVTPTGAALLAGLARPLGEDETLRFEKIGYGAGEERSGGGRERLPNVLRLALVRLEARKAARTVAALRATLDDMNPEHLGWLRGRLLDEGALEVYVTAVQMKKNRPGFQLTVLCEEGSVAGLARTLFGHSTTLGLRISREERLEMDRRTEEVETPYGRVLVKVARWEDLEERAAPEYESARRAAEAAGVSLRRVYRAAEEAWERRRSG